jgi:hypothetical protein
MNTWFNIEIDPVSSRLPEWELDGYLGKLELGRDMEEFVASATLWTADEYRKQWQFALSEVLELHRPAALLTSVDDPGRSSMLHWWPMYPEGDVVHFQNGILFFDQLHEPFKLSESSRFVPPRRKRTDDGCPISEWAVMATALESFMSRST